MIVQPLKEGPYRFVDVKGTKKEADDLVTELKKLNESVRVPEGQCKIIEKNINEK